MQLTISSNDARPYAPVAAPPVRSYGPAPNTSPPPATDRASFSRDGLQVAQYIERARSEPEVRQDLVDRFTREVREGNYPPPAITEGLTKLLGTALQAS